MPSIKEKIHNDYYEAGDLLIQHNRETGVYWIRNSVKLEDKRISKELFDSLADVERVKKQRFFELLNAYFKTVKHYWTYEGENYRKLDNFEIVDDSGIKSYGHFKCTNYDIVKLMHHTNKAHCGDNLILVYHWGHVYYMHYSYGGTKQSQLFDIKTGRQVKWTNAKNCAPIFNETKKVIM